MSIRVNFNPFLIQESKHPRLGFTLRTAKVIVAINKELDVPIFSEAFKKKLGK